MKKNWPIESVILLMLFIPLVVVGNIAPFGFGKAVAFRIGAEILLIVYLFSVIKKSARPINFNILFWALVFCLTSFFVSSAFGINPYKSFWGESLRSGGFVNLAHFFIFFLIASTIPKNYFFRFFKTSIFIAFIVSLLALSQRAGFSPLFLKSGLPASTIGNTALMSGYLLFNIFFALYFFANTPKHQKQQRLYYLSFILLGSLVIFLTNVRGAILGLLAGLIYFVSNSAIPNRYARLIYYAAVGGPVLILILAINHFAGYFELPFISDLVGRFANMTTVDSRFDSWRIALLGWTERPILGWGPENFSAIYSRYFNPGFFIDSISENSWDRVHNIFLETLLSQGIIGMVAFAFLVVAVIRLVKRISNKTDKLMVVSALIAYITHVSFVFDSISSLLMLFLVLAFLVSSNSVSEINVKKDKDSLWSRCLVWGGIILSPFSLYIFNLKPIIADQYFGQGKLLYIKTPEKSIGEFEKAINQNTPDKFYIRREFAVLVLTKADLSEKSGVLPSEDEFKFAIKQIEDNLKEEKFNVFDRLYLSSLYIHFGRQYKDSSFYNKAEELMLEAKRLFPHRQQIYYLLAESQLESGKTKDALENLNEAINLNPNSPESYWKLALAFKKIGRDQDAFITAQKADAMKYGGTRGYLPDILRLIDIHIAADQYGQLVSLYHRVMNTRPDYVQPYASVAAAYKEMGDKYSAVKYAERAVEIDPSSADQVKNFIRSMDFIGNYDYGFTGNGGKSVVVYEKPSAADLSGWTSYYDEHFKLSISAPADWNFYGAGGSGLRLKNDVFFNNLAYAKSGGFNKEGSFFANTIVTTGIKDDLKNWFIKNAAYPLSARNETFYYKDVVVNGLPGIVQYIRQNRPMYEGISPKTIKEYYFKRGDKIFQIKGYTVTGKNSEKLVSTFDKIISTLDIGD